MVEPGKYYIKAIGYETGITAKGDQKLTLRLQVKDGPVVYDVLTFSPKAMWKMDVVLKAFSVSKKKPLPAKGSKMSIDEDFMNTYIIDGFCEANVIIDEYNGVKRNRVGDYVVPEIKDLPPVLKTEPEPFELTSEPEEDACPF